MDKSLIYTAYTAGAEIPVGNTVPVGSIIRRYGKCIDATGSAINLTERGYYDVAVSVTFTAAVAGNVRLTLLQDGVEVTSIVRNTVASPVIEAKRQFVLGGHAIRIGADGGLLFV